MKSCSTSVTMRKMQMKTTMRYHSTPGTEAIIKKTQDFKCWPGCGGNGPMCTAGENVNWCTHYGKQYDGSSAIPYPKGVKLVSKRDVCTPMYISALFTIAKMRKQTKCPFMGE